MSKETEEVAGKTLRDMTDIQLANGAANCLHAYKGLAVWADRLGMTNAVADTILKNDPELFNEMGIISATNADVKIVEEITRRFQDATLQQSGVPAPGLDPKLIRSTFEKPIRLDDEVFTRMSPATQAMVCFANLIQADVGLLIKLEGEETPQTFTVH